MLGIAKHQPSIAEDTSPSQSKARSLALCKAEDKQSEYFAKQKLSSPWH